MIARDDTGFYWHVHHDTLFEWCFSYQGRAEYIRIKKPQQERVLRLKLFKRVQGTLPQEVQRAWRVYDGVRQTYVKGEKAYFEAVRKHQEAIESLHRKECPGCPWNGRTIFPAT